MSEELAKICPHTKKEYDCARCDGAADNDETGKFRVHLNHSITGPLANWNKKQWKEACEYIKKEDGSKFTADELKQEFITMNGLGWEVMPISECDRFCYKKGCMKHRAESEGQK